MTRDLESNLISSAPRRGIHPAREVVTNGGERKKKSICNIRRREEEEEESEDETSMFPHSIGPSLAFRSFLMMILALAPSCRLAPSSRSKSGGTLDME